MTKITIEVDTDLVDKYTTEWEFKYKLENWLGDMTPCPICHGEGWISHEGEGEHMQNDQHCPKCHGEKWENPFE